MIDIGNVNTLYALKDHKRVGWEIRGVTDPESVSDHSWGTALLCLLYAPAAGVDADHAIAMALVHDIAEAVTGDVASRVDERDRTVSQQQKQLNERAAMERLFPVAEATRVRRLWQEYEESNTAEARFVRDMNLIDMCLQASRYQRDRRYDPAAGYASAAGFERLDEFFATAEPRLSTALGRQLFEQIHAEYRQLI